MEKILITTPEQCGSNSPDNWGREAISDALRHLQIEARPWLLDAAYWAMVDEAHATGEPQEFCGSVFSIR